AYVLGEKRWIEMEILIVVFLIYRHVRFPSDAVVQGQPPADFPIVLNIQRRVILAAVVSVRRTLAPAICVTGASQHKVDQRISADAAVEGRQARGVHAATGPVVQLLAVNAAAESKLMRAL